MMSTVSLNGFVAAMIGPSWGGGCIEEPPGGSGVLPPPVTAGMVVIVVIVEDEELVLLAVFMPISMLDRADDTCSKFSINI